MYEHVFHQILSYYITLLFYYYDTLLVYGGRKQLDKLANSGEFILLGEVKENLVKVRFWWVSVLSIIMTILFQIRNCDVLWIARISTDYYDLKRCIKYYW